MFIGSREDVAHLGYTLGVCPKCGKEGAFTVSTARRKLTFYVIAAIPMNEQMVVECPACHVRFAIPKHEQQDMRKSLISAEDLSEMMMGNGYGRLAAPQTPESLGPNLYQQLQLDPAADPDVIDAAYKRLAFRYHPDRDKSPDAVNRMQSINEAKRILSDPDTRERYDRSIGIVRKPAPAPRPHPDSAIRSDDV